MSDGEKRPVVVTTKHRGVFFGYADDTTGTTIRLEKCRNCVRWSTAMKGFLGLAALGPDDGCRVGPAATLTVHDVTSVAECTPGAAEKWEAQPWS